jgi:hypothetical protein
MSDNDKVLSPGCCCQFASLLLLCLLPGLLLIATVSLPS